MIRNLFDFLVFPGFLTAIFVGLLTGGIDRVVTARIQWRKGPPLFQNFIDIIKLSAKEIIIPAGARFTFLLSPFFGLLAVSLAAAIIGRALINPLESFLGDVIVILYLLGIPAIALIIGASSSRNPLASVGASREMKLMLAYELPFIISLITVIVKSKGALHLGSIINYQVNNGANLYSFSGALAFICMLLCAHAKLGFVPFDVAEAEQEIMAGAMIEYSGLALALFKLTKAVLLYLLPLFLIGLFWFTNANLFVFIGKFLVIIVLFVLIKNTNPRLRIDQTIKFFWGLVTICALAGLGLAILGY